jgi:RimJ/RimL family protein N-acetyltransferase
LIADVSLSTSRLRVVPVRIDLAQSMFEAIQSSRKFLERYLPDMRKLRTRKHVADLLARSQVEWEAGTAARFAVLDPQQTLVGSVSIESDNAIPPEHLAFWRPEAAKQRGYMTEACTEVVRWSFETLGLIRLRANVAVKNASSIALLKRLDFRPYDTVKVNGNDEYVFIKVAPI